MEIGAVMYKNEIVYLKLKSRQIILANGYTYNTLNLVETSDHKYIACRDDELSEVEE